MLLKFLVEPGNDFHIYGTNQELFFCNFICPYLERLTFLAVYNQFYELLRNRNQDTLAEFEEPNFQT